MKRRPARPFRSRSLAGLDLSHEAPAKLVVERAVPALVDPHPLITELGEMYEETGRPEKALETWKALLARDPGQEERIKETAALLWDYGHMKEALDTIETGRRALARPRMLAFEAGVLREEVRDIDGAIREYLEAVRPDADTANCYCSGFENDQRSLRRLAQWMGRDRVLKRVLASIEALKPGVEGDEKTLLAFWPLGSISTPTAGLDWDADDWIDGLDQPNDPLGREEREAKRLAARGNEHAGIARVAAALVARATAMTPESDQRPLSFRPRGFGPFLLRAGLWGHGGPRPVLHQHRGAAG
jgi:tetratricopeptide (TPR) repeat protein